jgi:hypothetical protein
MHWVFYVMFLSKVASSALHAIPLYVLEISLPRANTRTKNLELPTCTQIAQNSNKLDAKCESKMPRVGVQPCILAKKSNKSKAGSLQFMSSDLCSFMKSELRQRCNSWARH